ncbi:MAG: glycoside hydrolase family 3 C-terminal domain-containing protein, partial [Isosphaeraceae bacterium]
RQVARECVQKSLVLVKNEKSTLPLSKHARRLVLAAQAADDLGIQCGGWTIAWQGKTGNVMRGGTTLLTAVRQAVGPNTEVTHSADGSGVAGADAVIVAIGERPYAEMRGDRKGLSLPRADLSVLKTAKEAGVPVVTVVFSGRPVLLGPVLESSDAVLAAWLPGTEGHGIADVLLGDVKPTGKLPHTWPRSMDQIPCNVDDGTAKDPLFPYDFGLTY